MDFPVSQNIYARLLRAYPAAHRAEYGAAMAQLFRDQCRDAWRDSGNWGLTKLWLRVLPDWASTSVRERIAALNERKTMNDKLASLSRDRTTPTAIFIRVAVVVFLITLMIATVMTYLLPEAYASTCKIKVEKDLPNVPSATNSPSTAYDPYFIQTEFEIIQSQLVLSNVIAVLNLNVEWGKKYFNGETLKTTETMEILKGRMALAPIKNTTLIAITVYSDDRNEAALIANAVAESYKDFRAKSRLDWIKPTIEALQKQYLQESNQITQLSEEVNQLSAKSTDYTNYQQQVLGGEQRYQEQNAQLLSLKKMDKAMLRDVLPTVSADGALSDLVTQLHEAERNLASALTNAENSKATRLNSLIGQLNQQVDERVAGIMAGLGTQMASLRASLDLMSSKVRAAKLEESAKLFAEKKQTLDEMLQAHAQVNAKILSVKIEAQIPHTQLVQVVDPATPSRFPVKPNKTLNLILGAVTGIFLGVLAGGAAAGFAARRGNRAAQNSPSA
jgi:uncharacterized protein involved in exopolysaccharide biosynthesis